MTRFRHVVLSGALLIPLALPAAVSAHSEIVSESPKNGATVQPGSLELVGKFSDTLNSRSHLELLDAAGHLIARGTIDGKEMQIHLDAIEPGQYEVQWTSVAEDGDVLRSTDNPDWKWEFAVAGASPSPSVTTKPSESAAASASVSASAAVTPARSASAPPSNPTGTSNGDVLLPIVAALVVVALLGGLLLRRRPPTVR